MAREMKVGDRLKCIESNSGWSITKDKIYIVTRIQYNEFHYRDDVDYEESWVIDGGFEKRHFKNMSLNTVHLFKEYLKLENISYGKKIHNGWKRFIQSLKFGRWNDSTKPSF